MRYNNAKSVRTKLDQTYITEWFISTETFSCVKVSQSKSHPYEDGTKQRHT